MVVKEDKKILEDTQDISVGKRILFPKRVHPFSVRGPLKFRRKTLGNHVFSYHHLWRSQSCLSSALSPITVATNTPSCLMAWQRKKKRRIPGLAYATECSKRQTHDVLLTILVNSVIDFWKCWDSKNVCLVNKYWWHCVCWTTTIPNKKVLWDKGRNKWNHIP